MQNQEAPEAPAPPPEDHGEMSFEDAMRSYEEQTPDTPEDAPAALLSDVEAKDTPEDPSEAKPAEEAPEALSVEPEEAPEETPADTRSLARIMERESALQTKQDAYDGAQAELSELRNRLDRYEGAQQSFSQDPISFIRSIAPEGTDLKRLAEGLWNEQLGEKAPADYLKQKEATRHYTAQDERLAKLEQENTERNTRYQQEEAQRGLNQYLGSLSTFVESAPKETFPLVALMQAKDPQTIAQTMETIARSHAQRTNGQVLTPEQVAGELEKQLGHYQLSAQPAKEPAPTPEQGASLRNSSTQTQPDRAADDELSDEFLRAKAMEALHATRE